MKNFTISNIDLRLKDTNELKAICSILINDMFAVYDIEIVENSSGKLVVKMPAIKMPDGSIKSICKPINAEAKRIIDEAVMEKYEKAIELQEEVLELLK